mgnify:CR=1 FL=1
MSKERNSLIKEVHAKLKSVLEEIHNNILSSSEVEIGVSIIFSKDNILEDVIRTIELLMEVI